MTTAIQSTINNSVCIASWSNHNYEMSDIYRHRVELLKHRDGRYLLVAKGGLPFQSHTKWITREQARRFVVEHAMNPCSGWGYTDLEADALLARRPVHGTREFDGLLLPRPDLSDF
jgi:hypothetical protein